MPPTVDHVASDAVARAFAKCGASGRPAVLPFVTAGYPSLASTAALLPRLAAACGSIIEVGIPFSDPIADGPVIAESMHEALLAGCLGKLITSLHNGQPGSAHKRHPSEMTDKVPDVAATQRGLIECVVQCSPEAPETLKTNSHSASLAINVKASESALLAGPLDVMTL